MAKDPNEVVAHDYRDRPITRQDVHKAVQDMSQQAQAAELSGDLLMAEVLHQGINNELDLLR